MNVTDKIPALLKKHKLSNTPCRRNVLEVFLKYTNALSHHDVESTLNYEFDRVTIYRTFYSFEEKGLIHKVIDNEGIARYALCSERCDTHHHHDSHLHFSCTGCHKTTCLEGSVIPEINIPGGFKIEKLSLLGEGLCKECSVK